MTIVPVLSRPKEVDPSMLEYLSAQGVVLLSAPGGGSEAIESSELQWLTHLGRLLASLASSSALTEGMRRTLLHVQKEVSPGSRRAASLITEWLNDDSGHDERFWPMFERDLAEAE